MRFGVTVMTVQIYCLLITIVARKASQVMSHDWFGIIGVKFNISKYWPKPHAST